MLDGIIKRKRAIEVRSTFHNMPEQPQGGTHEAMTDHERRCPALLFTERKELRGQLAGHLAIECYNVGDPNAVEDRE
jgi:hypothetical protein